MPDSATEVSAARLRAPPVLEVVRQHALGLLLTGAPLHESIAQLVEVDAVLTGLLLRLIRCPLYEGADARGIDVANALLRVGRPALVHAVTYLPGLPGHQAREDVESACGDWVHGVAVAAAARWLATSEQYEDAQEAYTAGLLHDLGGRCYHVAPCDAAAAAERLTERWHLGARTALVARVHEVVCDGTPAAVVGEGGGDLDERSRRLVGIVQRACRIAVALGYSARSCAGDSEIRAVAREAAEPVTLEVAHASALLGLDSGASEDFARVLANEEVRLGELGHERRPLGATAAVLAEAHRRVVGSRRLGSVADIVGRGLLAIREGLELDRVILLEPHPTEPFRLHGRAASDPSDLTYAGGVRGVAFELDGGSVLQQALERGRAVVGNCDEKDALVKRQLGVESFGGAVLRAGGKPMGLVIADRFFSGEPVRTEDVRHLEMLCDALGLVLDNKVLDLEGRKLRTLAEKDELTGLSNRRSLVSTLHTEMERARRFENALSVVMLYVDHFKRWNDVHGHQVGDMVLQSVAQLILACSREIDHCGRYGGEEFLIVLPETSVQHAVLYAERLRVTLEGHGADMFTSYSETPLTVSLGVTAMRAGDDIDTLIRRADTAMYAAKEHGRNRVCVETVQPLDVDGDRL